MKKAKRLMIYNMYDGHCAYCGKKIEYKDMQVDHCCPIAYRILLEVQGVDINHPSNLKCSCRSCNHYKRSCDINQFRRLMKTIHERIAKIYIAKVAISYGVVKIKPFDGKFYFERCEEKQRGENRQRRTGDDLNNFAI